MTRRRIIVLLILLWLVTAYLALPRFYRRKEKAVAAASPPPVDEKVPRHTETSAGIPGDPVNLVFIGSRDAIIAAMLGAGWHPADPITLKSSLEIAAGSVFHRSYEDAPVSPLLLWGKPQALTFEL